MDLPIPPRSTKEKNLVVAQLPEKTGNSSTRLKIAIAGVIVLCVVGLLVLLVGIGLYQNRVSLAQPPEWGSGHIWDKTARRHNMG